MMMISGLYSANLLIGICFFTLRIMLFSILTILYNYAIMKIYVDYVLKNLAAPTAFITCSLAFSNSSGNFLAMVKIHLQALLKTEDTRLIVYKCQHNDAEGILQRR